MHEAAPSRRFLWLLKRGISGTYVSVEPFHLFRYLDEQMFRFNNRGISRWRKLAAFLRAQCDARGAAGKR